MRVMNPIKQEFEDRDVEFVAVNIWEEPEGALRFVDANPYEYRWARTDDASIERLGIESIPALIIIDENGDVVWRSSLFTMLRRGNDMRGVLKDLTRG